MSRSRARRLLLGCTAESAILLATQKSATAASELLATLAIAAQPHAALSTLCDALPGLRPATAMAKAVLCVTVDDSLARIFLVTPPPGARSLDELKATAAARFTSLYGESAASWQITAEWQATQPFIACALPRELVVGIATLLRTQQWFLASLAPALVRVWNLKHAAIPCDGWLLVAFGLTLTIVHTRGGQVAGVRTLRFPNAPDGAELATLITQERLRASLQQDSDRLLWSGAADWLPVAGTIAGIASQVLPLRSEAAPAADPANEFRLACQLALAGRSQR